LFANQSSYEIVFNCEASSLISEHYKRWDWDYFKVKKMLILPFWRWVEKGFGYSRGLLRGVGGGKTFVFTGKKVVQV